MHDYEECTIFLLSKAYQRAYAELKERLKPYGLTPVQQLVLAALWKEDGLTAGEIGKRIVLDSATLSGTLERMVAAGWINKEPDPDDRRAVRVRLTERGRALDEAVTQARWEANEALLSRLNLEEKILLKRLLRDLRD